MNLTLVRYKETNLMNKAGIYTPEQIEDKFEIAWNQIVGDDDKKINEA